MTEAATTERVPDRPEHPSGWGPLVKGTCPACRLTSLFLAEGGYVTCASLSCTDPGAASDVLEKNGRCPRCEGLGYGINATDGTFIPEASPEASEPCTRCGGTGLDNGSNREGGD